MTDAVPTSSTQPAPAGPPAGVNLALWEQATVDQQKVLRRIAVQRGRLRARASARAQALALRDSQSGDHVRADAPLTERLMTFARLHPVAVAVAAAAALAVGPRKLFRLGGVILPWIIRLQQKRREP